MTVNVALIARLQRVYSGFIFPQDIEAVDRQITIYRERGWTDDEIFRFVRYTEHVCPHLDEDIALARMAKIHEEVAARLGVDP